MSDLASRMSQALGDRYDVQRELGQGGMAVVFLAEDRKHHRPVAIKVLRPELAATLGTERFLREIEVAAGLNHPGIVTLHDSGEAAGLLYFVMPYIEGDSLRERLRRDGPLPVDDAVRIAGEVGEALSYAHSRGLVHRDVKPENILFRAGHAVVADFGIARALSEAAGERLTETGLAIGTLSYMSPEQATGEADARADVYALGCVLHEMLTGEPPFRGKTPQAVLAQKLMGGQADLAAAREGIPPTVAEVVRMALEPDPSRRFQTADFFSEGLRLAVTARAIEEDARRRRHARLTRGFGWIGAAAVVALGGWWAMAASQGPSVERLAVLPFTLMVPDTEQAYFVDGVHDGVISELQMAGVAVIARRSVMRYRESDASVREIADELGLDAVLEASVRVEGDSVILDARLVDGDSEEYLWLDSFRRDVRDVMSLYRDVTRAVAGEIGLELSQDARVRLAAVRPRVNQEAYEAYLRGRAAWRDLTPGGLDRALRYFQISLDIDSTFAPAHGGLAAVWAGRAQMGLVPSDSVRPRVMAAVEKALALDSTLAEVHYRYAATEAWVGWNWDVALAEFQRALELNPNDAEVHAYYAHVLYFHGRAEEAWAHAERAVELDPVEPLYQALMGMSLYYEHRYEEAIEVVERALELNPTAPLLLSTLRTVYHLAGLHEQALQAWVTSYESRRDTAAVNALNRGWAEGGYEGALVALAETMVERSDTTFVPPWNIATMLIRAGRYEDAYPWLEQAFARHSQNMPSISADPIFDPLRDDPRFQRLLEGVGLGR